MPLSPSHSHPGKAMPAMDMAGDDVEVEEVLLELTPVTSKRSRARAVTSAVARSAGDGSDDGNADASSGAGVTTAAAAPPAPPARASAVTPAMETNIELLRQAEEAEAALLCAKGHRLIYGEHARSVVGEPDATAAGHACRWACGCSDSASARGVSCA